MSNGGRIHRHKCPECKQTWSCGEYQCYRTGYAERKMCHGSSCAQQAKPKPEARPERPAEPDLFGGE